MKILVVIVLAFCLVPEAYGASVDDYLDSIVEVHALQPTLSSSGAGFFVSEDGRIVTAYHVVQGASQVFVTTQLGTFKDITVESYDAARDLIVLKINAGATKKFKPLALAPPPPKLRDRHGYAIGHPNGKSNFSCEITFPSELIAAQQWSIGNVDQKYSRYIFATDELKLLPLNGTLNVGMSGGPVVINGTVIGVISGSEEGSGAGLGWAIPIAYLGGTNMTRSATGKFSDLPQLSMLTRESAHLKSLKTAETLESSELTERYLQLQSDLPALDALIQSLEPLKKFVLECSRRSGSVEELKKLNCVEYLVAESNRLSEFKKFADQFSGYLEVGNAALTNAPYPSPQKVRGGYYRQLSNLNEVWDSFYADYSQAFARRVACPESIQRAPEESEESYVKRSFERYSGSIRCLESTARFYRQAITWVAPFHFMLVKTVDFEADPALANKQLRLEDLTELESAYFLGRFAGWYTYVDLFTRYCQEKRMLSPEQLLRASAWRQRMAPARRRAEKREEDLGIAKDVDDGLSVVKVSLLAALNETVDLSWVCEPFWMDDSNNDFALAQPEIYELLTGETPPSKMQFNAREFDQMLLEYIAREVTNGEDIGSSLGAGVIGMIDALSTLLVGQVVELESERCSADYPELAQRMRPARDLFKLVNSSRFANARAKLYRGGEEFQEHMQHVLDQLVAEKLANQRISEGSNWSPRQDEKFCKELPTGLLGGEYLFETLKTTLMRH